MPGKPANTGIGAPVRRREDRRLLTGGGRYSDDLNLPGQAYAVMLRSPHAHALIRAIDTAAASAAPGVLAVLTGAELRADGLHPIPHAVWSNHPAEIALPDRAGATTYAPPHHCMAIEAAHQVGDIVAVVVASSLAAARDGAERVAVDYQPLPAVTRALAAAAPGAPLAHADAPGNLCVDSAVGDEAATDAAFARAAHVVRLDTWVQRVVGVPMEPRAAIGVHDRDSGKYTLHAGAGGAVRPRNDLAAVLGVPQADVRMVMHDVGGNFGTRGAFNPEFALVVWAARRVGRPVKWTGTRSEAFLSDYQARDLSATAELALAADGTFLAMRGSNLVNIGAYPVGFSPLQKGVAIASSIYHVPTVHFRARAALTNTAPTRPYRSAGRPEVMFVMERLIDLAARQSGLDRIALRRRNLIPETAMPYRNPFGMVYDSGAYHTVMERALTLGDWNGFPARRAAARTRGQLPRHRRRQLRGHRHRRAARARRDDRQTRRRGGAGHRHRLAGPGPRDQLRPARHRMARRAQRQRAPGDRRHRPGEMGRRRAFRPRAAPRQHRHAQRRARDHCQGDAHRRPCAEGRSR